MSNVLNSIIANQPIHPIKQEKSPVFTFDTDGKVKPLEYKGQLLPSRIFGSPVEYMKDLKNDVLSIGKAATGKANDHQLGRINDLAMKLGAIGLASYLFVKNPLKMNKAMEFIGVGTFFGGMALWPKLAIQAPIKARTGVDIHQKYIDSQGRKKMLHQDPQYDLTDLYSREDLDKMGKKLKVSENLPDRDNFIKQRAKKTAIQGNTLWMMSAASTPLISALACNRLEKPVQAAIEKFDLVSSAVKMERGASQGPISKLKQVLAENSITKFIQQNSDRVLDDKLISELSVKLGGKANAASLQDAIKEELKALKNTVKIDESFVREAIAGKISPDVFTSLSEVQRAALDKAMADGSVQSVADILASLSANSKPQQKKLSQTLVKVLNNAKKAKETPTLSQVTDKIKAIHTTASNFAAQKGVLDNFITARVGDKSGTYIANQWGRVGDKLVKVLKLNTKDLKALSQGNMEVLTEKLSKLAANDAEYDKAINELMKLIGDYESRTNSSFMTQVKQKAQDVCSNASREMQANGLSKMADKVTSSAKRGTIENIISVNTSERVVGAQSSFYRLIQSLDLFKAMKNGSFEQQLTKLIKEQGQNADSATIEKLTKACQKIVLSATTTDYIEKLESAGFKLSENEYKIVMKALFGNNPEAAGAVEQSLVRSVGSEKAKEMIQGFKSYKDEFMNKIANWRNSITPDLANHVVTGATDSANAIERNNIAGKPITSMIQDIAKQTYNSRKWLKIFGISLAAITTITLVAGLTFGKKGKMEKQVEEESKVNG